MANNLPEYSQGTLWINQGMSPCTVTEHLDNLSDDFEQPLFWFEPALQLNADGSPGRLKNFAPFAECVPVHLPILEAAYVFGSYRGQPYGTHIIAVNEGCRWLEFSAERRANTTSLEITQRKPYSVLTRRDFERFFGEGEKPRWGQTEKLIVTEYWQDSGLLAWWLKKHKLQETS